MSNYLEQYYTPPPLTRALLERLNLEPMTIAEPCAGEGWIARELIRDGHTIIAGDVDPELDLRSGLDFFSKRATGVYGRTDAIITNPPWSDSARFVRRALEITPNVAMLLRLTFLEPCDSEPASRRVDLLRIMRSHIVMPRTRFYKGGKKTDSVPPMWFVWGFDWLDIPAFDVVTTPELARHAGQQNLFSNETKGAEI